MTNIIGLDLANVDEEESRVFVNTDTITHWHHSGDNTTVHLVSGTSITVEGCPWEILERIEPDDDEDEEGDEGPQMVHAHHQHVAGTMTVGESVTLDHIIQWDNGDVTTNRFVGTVKALRAVGDEEYVYFSDGMLTRPAPSYAVLKDRIVY